MGPWSVHTLALDYDMIHSTFAGNATIPPDRLRAVRAKLRAVGFDEPGLTTQEMLDALTCHALANDGRSPGGRRVVVPKRFVFDEEPGIAGRRPVCPAP